MSVSKRIFITLVSLMFMVFLFAGCSSSGSPEEKKFEFDGPTVSTTIKVECDSNLVFSRYNLIASIDGVEIGEIAHGGMEIFHVDLAVGSYELTLANAEDTKVKGIVPFTVDETNHSFEFKASCTKDRVNIDLTSPNPETATSENTSSDEGDAEVSQGNMMTDAEIRSKFEDMKGKSLTKFYALCKELGYTYRLFSTYNDKELTDSLVPGDDASKAWEILEIDNIDTDDKKVVVYIANTKTKNAKEKLETKLPASYAWSAVKRYGEMEYPYGFKLHNIIGRLAEEARSNGTWFLKATCDVKNQYGTWAKDLTCEATVSGTEDNPHIDSFNVY